MLIITEYIKTHTVVLWFAIYSVRILARTRHHGCFDPCKGVDWWTWANLHYPMFIRARAADSCSLVMVAASYFLSLCNVQSHRSSSADLICNVLEICSLKRIHGQAFNCTTRKVFFCVEPLVLPTEKLPHEN